MATIIDGTTGIDKITDGSVVAADIGAGEVGATQLASTLDLSGKTITLATDAVDQLSTASGSAPSYSARAWVKFSSVGTLTITASGNVSSITDNGTGDYTVNFTTAMPDSHYALAATCDADLVNGALCYMYGATAPSTTACRLATKLLNGTTTDRDRISATFTR